MLADDPESKAQDLFSAGGEMGALMRAFDWSKSPLGAPDAWPQSLRSAVQLMVANRHLMFIAWGPELAFLYNDGYSPVLGKKHPWALGRPFREVWHEIWDDIEPLVNEALSGRATWSEDLHLVMQRHGYPEDCWYTFSYSPLLDENGGIAGMFCAGSETTSQVLGERRRKALLELDDRLRDVADPEEIAYVSARLLGEALNASRVGYGDLDPETGTITVGRTWSVSGLSDVAGVHSFKEYGNYLEALTRGEDVAVADVTTDPRTRDRTAMFEHHGIRAFLDAPVMENGRAVSEVFVHSLVPRVWSDDEIAVAREFAERARAAVARRRADAALRQSESRYRALFEAIDEGFCIIEFVDGPHGPLSDYVHIEANPAYASNAGIPEIEGKRLREIVSESEADAWAEIYRGVLTRGEPIRFERELVETGRYLELAAFRLAPEAQRQVAVLFKDVTSRKRAEEQLRELNETLERRIREAIEERKRAEEALRQSQKLEAMGQLTGGVAHDFNNLLTPILGALDMLKRGAVGGARERRLIEGALQSADRARILVQRLLAFARRQPLQPSPVNVGRLIEEMGELVSSTTGPNIRVVVDVPAELPAATADPNQLEMALLNLAVNARDAMPDGGTMTLSVRAETVGAGHHKGLGPGDYIRLSVTDTGEGMDELTLNRAIEPFFSTKGVGKGTGLGLSMVHGLAAQLGGVLHIASELNKGTIVELWVPSSDLAAEVHQPLESADIQSSAGTALVIDDEPLVRASTADMLEDLGYVIVEADSAESALRLFATDDFQPDLVVTDHLMQGMSGTDLARRLRAMRPGLPVLVVSGYAEAEGIAADLPRLGKPFLRADLARALRELTRSPSNLS